MRGDVETVKGRLDIAEVISGYLKLEKAGANFKARCPFHNEKTPSFFISTARQTFYCFGCGAKGDIFSFVEQIEGLEFRDALKMLAQKAGVEIEYQKAGVSEEKNRLLDVLEIATQFFEKELEGNKLALGYITSRGITDETRKKWRLGFAPKEWRTLYSHIVSLGYDSKILIKTGLIKTSAEKVSAEPYDVFRDRIIFPLFDANGRVIAFSGRALSKDTEPKYLNSPDTPVFTKGEVLYGFDKAKEDIRKKNYTVLVEGQIDLVLSHQAGVLNTTAASGTAFTQAHLERLKKLSSRIILAFDGDSAGEKAAEKASILGMSLGFDVKVASIPIGADPADLIKKDPLEWKNVLRGSLPAIEYFLGIIEKKETDPRKIAKQVEQKILPMVKLVKSSMEQSFFISLISKHTGLNERLIWEDLKRAKTPEVSITNFSSPKEAAVVKDESPKKTHQEKIEERLAEIRLWKKELSDKSREMEMLEDEESELEIILKQIGLKANLQELTRQLSLAESEKNSKEIERVAKRIKTAHEKIKELEGERKLS